MNTPKLGQVETVPTHEVEVAVDGLKLQGDWCLPPGAAGLVLFAHGSGSSRHSPRNKLVARALQAAGIGTLLFDLLTVEEERDEAETGALRFDIGLLAGRLAEASHWVARRPDGRRLGLGYFGASTGGAAALVAAAELGSVVDAVVSRGGRPDLAGEALGRVKSPTLLLVGERDQSVEVLNRAAFERLRCAKELVVVPRATHLFQEPGTLEEVARRAAEWFQAHLKPR